MSFSSISSPSKSLYPKSIRIGLIDPNIAQTWAQRILSDGTTVASIKKGDTINHTTSQPIATGLFCQRIFGPCIDYTCACGHEKIRIHRNVNVSPPVCPECHVEWTDSSVRRQRLGSIELISPVTHKWFSDSRNYIPILSGITVKTFKGLKECKLFFPFSFNTVGLNRNLSSQNLKIKTTQNKATDLKILSFLKNNRTNQILQFLGQQSNLNKSLTSEDTFAPNRKTFKKQFWYSGFIPKEGISSKKSGTWYKETLPISKLESEGFARHSAPKSAENFYTWIDTLGILKKKSPNTSLSSNSVITTKAKNLSNLEDFGVDFGKVEELGPLQTGPDLQAPIGRNNLSSDRLSSIPLKSQMDQDFTNPSYGLWSKGSKPKPVVLDTKAQDQNSESLDYLEAQGSWVVPNTGSSRVEQNLREANSLQGQAKPLAENQSQAKSLFIEHYAPPNEKKVDYTNSLLEFKTTSFRVKKSTQKKIARYRFIALNKTNMTNLAFLESKSFYTTPVLKNHTNSLFREKIKGVNQKSLLSSAPSPVTPLNFEYILTLTEKNNKIHSFESLKKKGKTQFLKNFKPVQNNGCFNGTLLLKKDNKTNSFITLWPKKQNIVTTLKKFYGLAFKWSKNTPISLAENFQTKSENIAWTWCRQSRLTEDLAGRASRRLKWPPSARYAQHGPSYQEGPPKSENLSLNNSNWEFDDLPTILLIEKAKRIHYILTTVKGQIDIIKKFKYLGEFKTFPKRIGSLPYGYNPLIKPLVSVIPPWSPKSRSLGAVSSITQFKKSHHPFGSKIEPISRKNHEGPDAVPFLRPKLLLSQQVSTRSSFVQCAAVNTIAVLKTLRITNGQLKAVVANQTSLLCGNLNQTVKNLKTCQSENSNFTSNLVQKSSKVPFEITGVLDQRKSYNSLYLACCATHARRATQRDSHSRAFISKKSTNWYKHHSFPIRPSFTQPEDYRRQFIKFLGSNGLISQGDRPIFKYITQNSNFNNYKIKKGLTKESTCSVSASYGLWPCHGFRDPSSGLWSKCAEGARLKTTPVVLGTEALRHSGYQDQSANFNKNGVSTFFVSNKTGTGTGSLVPSSDARHQSRHQPLQVQVGPPMEVYFSEAKSFAKEDRVKHILMQTGGGALQNFLELTNLNHCVLLLQNDLFEIAPRLDRSQSARRVLLQILNDTFNELNQTNRLLERKKIPSFAFLDAESTKTHSIKEIGVSDACGPYYGSQPKPVVFDTKAQDQGTQSDNGTQDKYKTYYRSQIDRLEKKYKDLKKEYKAVKKICTDFQNRKNVQKRRYKLAFQLLRTLSNPAGMTLSSVPVLPPGLRPIIDVPKIGPITADLNIRYRGLIFALRNLRELAYVDFRNTGAAQASVQEAVDDLLYTGGKTRKDKAVDRSPNLYKSLAMRLKGKHGRFRGNLLGKRVDYSGRSVIVVGPTLKIHQCGLPFEIATRLFNPFLIRRLIQKGLCKNVYKAKQILISGKFKPLIWTLCREVMLEHLVLLNRAPTLHRLGVQAFMPILISGRAILLHPLVCTGFNADFDGDQMGVHIPLFPKARAEAWKMMWSRNNFLAPSSGEPILLPSQDMVLGCYYLTEMCLGIKPPPSFRNFYKNRKNGIMVGQRTHTSVGGDPSASPVHAEYSITCYATPKVPNAPYNEARPTPTGGASVPLDQDSKKNGNSSEISFKNQGPSSALVGAKSNTSHSGVSGVLSMQNQNIQKVSTMPVVLDHFVAEPKTLAWSWWRLRWVRATWRLPSVVFQSTKPLGIVSVHPEHNIAPPTSRVKTQGLLPGRNEGARLFEHSGAKIIKAPEITTKRPFPSTTYWSQRNKPLLSAHIVPLERPTWSLWDPCLWHQNFTDKTRKSIPTTFIRNGFRTKVEKSLGTVSFNFLDSVTSDLKTRTKQENNKALSKTKENFFDLFKSLQKKQSFWYLVYKDQVRNPTDEFKKQLKNGGYSQKLKAFGLVVPLPKSTTSSKWLGPLNRLETGLVPMHANHSMARTSSTSITKKGYGWWSVGLRYIRRSPSDINVPVSQKNSYIFITRPYWSRWDQVKNNVFLDKNNSILFNNKKLKSLSLKPQSVGQRSTLGISSAAHDIRTHNPFLVLQAALPPLIGDMGNTIPKRVGENFGGQSSDLQAQHGLNGTFGTKKSHAKPKSQGLGSWWRQCPQVEGATPITHSRSIAGINNPNVFLDAYNRGILNLQSIVWVNSYKIRNTYQSAGTQPGKNDTEFLNSLNEKLDGDGTLIPTLELRVTPYGLTQLLQTVGTKKGFFLNLTLVPLKQTIKTPFENASVRTTVGRLLFNNVLQKVDISN